MATIRLKKSSVTGKEPLASDLEYGELALNYADGVLYYKNNNNIIANISGGGATADSDAPSGATLRAGDLWWDAVNGRLKIYYDDGDPAADTPITVSLTVDAALTTNAYYHISNQYTDRRGVQASGAQNPTIYIQQGDTVDFSNPAYTVHPLYYVTQLDPVSGNYNSSYNVELPASNYGGGTNTVSYQFNSPGTYYYICGVHTGMYGIIEVSSSTTASKQWVDASPQGRGYTGSAGAINYSENAPANPAGGQIWYDTKTGKSYMYYIVSGYGHWVLFSDPTIADGNEGFTGSQGYAGSRGTISPRGLAFLTPQVNDEQTLLYSGSSLTVSEIRGVIRGGTDVDVELKYATSRNLTGTTIASGTISNSDTGATLTVTNSSIPSGSYVWCVLTGVTGIVNEFHLNVEFSE